MELVDITDLKSVAYSVRVQVPSGVQNNKIMCRGKNIGRRFDKINGKCKSQFAETPRGIARYKQQTRKKRRQWKIEI